ncbi:uncharacterized protein LOC141594960 [Silene latifolia]|uniref:uncharacterized protein LOC141594960 n=1 Tax=Silene latifolia TaxID=37657 RepID=UPI003D775A34
MGTLETPRSTLCNISHDDDDDNSNDGESDEGKIVHDSHVSNNPDAFDDDLIERLTHMIDEHNVLAKVFRTARDRFTADDCKDIKLCLIERRAKDGRTYNLPNANEVGALIVGDIGCIFDERDIIVETQNEKLQRINELHLSYLALQYPLLFPFGEDGYMIENYQDAMASCKEFGFPDLFITFTCNPKWPEISRYVKRIGVRPGDRPDILCKVSKIKLDQLIRDLKNKKLFGRVQSVMYTAEFQKGGLPHVHILLFLHREDKFPNPESIDKIISAEIPDKEKNPRLYQIVSELMIHGLCGNTNRQLPCMENGKCSKHSPKKLTEHTTVDKEGYPVCRRRNNSVKIVKGTFEVDNGYVIPYNLTLLLKYHAHVNVEWCNQSRSINYMFKYINKGNDRVTAAVSACDSEEVDEIKMYYDCRYILACEAA